MPGWKELGRHLVRVELVQELPRQEELGQEPGPVGLVQEVPGLVGLVQEVPGLVELVQELPRQEELDREVPG